MIIKSYDLKKNLDKSFFLFYGQNAGYIEEKINDELKPLFSKNIYNYEENEVLINKNNFKEEIFNQSFFEKDKLIIINRVSDKFLDLIEEIYEKNNEDIKIILKSGILEKKSKLRNFFEKKENLIIIPFYEDNNQTLYNLAQNFFRKNKINISAQNINFIIEKTKNDRMILKNELEKIKNFTYKKSSIEFNDLLKITSSAEDYKISILTDQYLVKNKKKVMNILNENNPSLEDNILILKSFLYKLKRLKKLKIGLNENKNLDNVIASYKPVIFWKDKEIIKKQINSWSMNEIKLLIKRINNLELAIKKNSSVSNQIINNFILEEFKTFNSVI